MNFEKIAKALAICLPETKEESLRECVECPYYEHCQDNGSMSLPTDLMMDIRKYFSANKLDSNYLQ